MTSDEYARLKAIVVGALGRPEADRDAYIAARCGSDAAARVEIESLLTAVVRADGLYEAPALLVAGNTLTWAALENIRGVSLPFVSPPTFPFRAAREDEFHGTARYAVRRRIGAGGMGVVYEVEDRERTQVVALKTLRRRSGDDIYQLKREFRNLADVAHPNLVSLYDLVVDEDQCFFTMELVEGVTFVEHARTSGPLSGLADRLRKMLVQLVDGVDALHRRGLQHRDIKPSNVMVTPAGRVVILDFGLTSALLREDRAGGALAGTPAYLSPERCDRGEVSNAGDWYAVGVMLFHALTGHVPFDGPVREIIARKTTEDAPPVSSVAPDVPGDLDDVCMSLLRRDPADRISGREALERLAIGDRRPAGPRSTGTGFGGNASLPCPEAGSWDVFVGREGPLEALSAAFTNVTHGRTSSVAIYGPSGIGKSALVQRFIDRRLSGERVLVLRSRCHEHESIPYKAVDGLVDGVTRHLAALPPDELLDVLHPGARALARLFPVMRAIGLEAEPEHETRDPILLRRRAFGAFRELLDRLGRRQPVVIDIDDFHWADADSVRWLMDLLHPPGPCSLLTLIAFRSEETGAKAFLRSLVERVDIGERLLVPLAPMSDKESLELVQALLPAGADSEAQARFDIVRDSGGNPFLVEALAHHAALGASSSEHATLDEMVTRRLDALLPGARAFLEMLAVCGRPELPARVFEACGLHGDERRLVAQLRAAHLVRNSRSEDRVELYHDRIRETVAARVSPDEARRIHELMAQVLVAHGDDDPDALFEHYRAAGHPAEAAVQAVAAGAKASGVLAFDLAATFYRHALDLQGDAAERPQWSARLARALEDAGRPVEAAEAYLDAAHAHVVRGFSRAVADTIEWRRKAAELFLVGGQIDRGLAVIDDVLRTVGMRLARGPRTAIASLVLRRFQLRMRGLDFARKDESAITPGDLLRIDACWSISAGLAMVDPIRAAAFNVRQLLRALDVGDPYRISRALALEAGFSVVGGGGRRRSEVFSRRARSLAQQAGDGYVGALTSLWAGIAAFLTGQWKKAAELCGRAVTVLRDECTGVTWELNMAHNFFLGGLVAQGELREVARHLPGLLRSAQERGNFYLELELSTRMILVWLAGDDPDGAERRATEGIARWSQRGFQRQHFNHLLTVVQTALYRGDARKAWELMEGRQTALRRSFFLRVQHTRIEAANYRARCALAMAGAGHDARRMRAIATHEVKRINRENMPWSYPFAQVLEATIACQQGQVESAVARLNGAIEGFESADMHLYAAVCRRRLGALVGGDSGAALRDRAERWMAGQDIRDPNAMTRLASPGFPD